MSRFVRPNLGLPSIPVLCPGYLGPALQNITYPMLRNIASGTEINLPGWKSGFRAGNLIGKNLNRPSGRPSAGRRADVEAFPIRIRPKSGPARKHYCIT